MDTGAAATRQKALYLIQNGAVFVNGNQARKPSENVDGKTVEVRGEGLRYVSRGGLKLEEALKVFRFDPAGKICLDLGASTGGFTDCLLQNGAKRVYALDVGRDQLDEKLKSDSRVVSIEGFNARDLKRETLPEQVDLVVSDLSFISQRLIYEPLSTVMNEGTPFISLIKPQFEAGPGSVGKNGIVRDPAVHIRVIEELCEEARASLLYMHALCLSPITGGDGNREYPALFVYKKECDFPVERIREVVYQP